MNNIINTKYGKAKITPFGYYRITSRKEGNKGKLLHRLVWENWYGKPVPKGYQIHHINGDRLDNRIQNLQCVESSLHHKFHNKNRIMSEETKQKISDSMKGKYCKEKSPHWKDCARVIKKGFRNGKQYYSLRYNGKNIKGSIDKDKLLKEAEMINNG